MQKALLSLYAKFAIGVTMTAFFLDALLQMIIIPLIPVYKATFALNPTEVSIILSTGQFMVLFLGVFLGKIIDKIAGIQSVLGTLSVIFLSFVSLLYAFAQNWTILVIASAVQGLSMALLSPSMNTLLTKLVSKDLRATLLVRVNTLVNISFLLAPIVTAGLFNALGTKHALIIVFFVCILEAVVLLITYARLPKKSISPEVAATEKISSPKATVMLGAGLFSLVVAVFELIIPLDLAVQLRLTPSDIAIALFMIGIGFALPQWWVPNLTKRHGARVTIILGGLGLIVGNAILSFAHGWYFATIVVLTSPFAGVVLASVTNLVGSTEAIGESFGIMQSSISAGYIVGSMGAGFLLKIWGSTATLLFASVATLIVVICISLIRAT